MPHEVRAVWITTASSLDWPLSTDPQRQKQELVTVLDELQKANFNTILFQVRARGDAYYRSRLEPWAENLTGTLGRDPGWDPLAFLIEEAHNRFIEVHAWFNVYKIRGLTPVGPSTPEHPARAYPSWTAEVDGEIWFDPGIPEVRTYLLEVALDLVRSYDLDGVNFDFVRYPGREFPDAGTFSRYGGGQNLDDWRRQNITRFVREFYTQATSAKAWLKVGSSPLGIYREDNANNRGSYHAVYQDSYGWLRDGIHDYLSPQVYWTIRPSSPNAPDFAAVLRRWKRWPTARHIYPGIAAYRPEIEPDLVPYVDTTRALGFGGQVFFRLENLHDFTALGGRYARPALPPVMPWKDGVPPSAPSGVTVARASGNVYRVTWSSPDPARDGGTAWDYNVYRWPTPSIRFEDPASLIARVRGTRTEFLDTVQASTPLPYTYAVTAVDRLGLESIPSASVQAPTTRDSANIAPVPASFSIALANDTGLPVATSYTLGCSSRVTLDILRKGLHDTLYAPLVRAVQQEGTYRIPLDGIVFPPGTYLFRLQAGENVLEQTVLVGGVKPEDPIRR